MRRNELYNLRVKNIRRVNNREVCDLMNGDGRLVLSGNIEWVQDTAVQRHYEVENVQEANAKLDALRRSWGSY